MIKLSITAIGWAVLLCSPFLSLAEDLQVRFFKIDANPAQRVQPSQVEYDLSWSSSGTLTPEVSDSRQKKISRTGAALRSLVVPGWGESYLGYHKTARYFFWVEVALWTTVIGLETYSQWKEDQFISFAASHAGANLRGKSDKYYADVGNYDNTEAYNQAKLRERNYEAMYTSPAYYWAWDDSQNRHRYDDMRISSKSAHQKIYLFIGAAALNRLISFIDTSKKARDVLNREKSVQIGFRVEPDVGEGYQAVRFVLSAVL